MVLFPNQYKRGCSTPCAHNLSDQKAPARQRRYPELLREFDPAPPERQAAVRRNRAQENQAALCDLLDDAKFEGEEIQRGRRFICWRTIQDQGSDNTPMFMAKLLENVRTAFYLRHVYSNQLRNIENGDAIIRYTNQGSPWFHSMA